MTDTPAVTPFCDQASQAVVDQAVASLGTVRDPDWLGDAGVRLHVLASLIAQATALLPDTVAEGRDPIGVSFDATAPPVPFEAGNFLIEGRHAS